MIGGLMRASRSMLKLRPAAPAVRPLLLLGAVVLLVISPPAEALRKDGIPPIFDGLKSATTCIPGPIYEGRTTSYHLSWDPPTDTTPAGATSFDTPLLPADKTFYFVVRARDQAGNSDSNTVERQGVNLCV